MEFESFIIGALVSAILITQWNKITEIIKRIFNREKMNHEI
jgi:hypothetical protein